MATKIPRSHQVKAAHLAHELFAPKEDAPPSPSVYKNITLSMPIGILARLDAAARRSGNSRSATAALLLDIGMGSVLETLTPKQRREFVNEADSASVPEGYQVTQDASFTVNQG